MSESLNKRHNQRRRTLFSGIVYDAENKKWECSVSDISETGVKVRGKLKLTVGTNIELKINKFNLLIAAEVVWDHDDTYGLQFATPLDRYDSDYKGIFGIMNLSHG